MAFALGLGSRAGVHSSSQQVQRRAAVSTPVPSLHSLSSTRVYPASASGVSTSPQPQQCASSSGLTRRTAVLQPLVLCASSAASTAAAAAAASEVVTATSTSSSTSTTDVSTQQLFTPQPHDPPTNVTATGRIVAIGDLHGDWQKAVQSLQAANVVRITQDNKIEWAGGDTVVVQLGDVLDRGDYEIAIIRLLRDLDKQARAQGGAVYMLNGNHESLNISGHFRYVTPGAFVESGFYAGLSEKDMKDWASLAKVRYTIYRPGGPMAVELSKNPTVLVVNDTAFAHGGLLPIHVNYGVEKLNHEVARWMRGEATQEGGKVVPPFLAMGDANSVMWNRTLSRENFPTPYERFHACNALKQALDKLGAKRLVVGHTPQLGGANCECDGRVWRIDVGMSSGVLNRPVQVLEIVPKGPGEDPAVRILPSDPQASMMGTSDDDDPMRM